MLPHGGDGDVEACLATRDCAALALTCRRHGRRLRRAVAFARRLERAELRRAVERMRSVRPRRRRLNTWGGGGGTAAQRRDDTPVLVFR